MPTSTITSTGAYAHCRNPRCPGYAQAAVDGNLETVSYTFRELAGGDRASVPGVERSIQYTKFANPADEACPHCTQAREVTIQKRPTYQTTVPGAVAPRVTEVPRPSPPDIAA